MIKPPIIQADLRELRWREELSDRLNFLYEPPFRSVTSAYTATFADKVILANATGGAFSITLPSGPENARKSLYIKRVNSGLNAVTLDPAGSETIDNSATLALSALQGVFIFYDGSSWWSF